MPKKSRVNKPPIPLDVQRKTIWKNLLLKMKEHHKQVPPSERFHRGYELIRKQNYENALEEFRRVVHAQPDHKFGHFYMGYLEELVFKNYRQAFFHYRNAHKLHHVNATFRLGILYYHGHGVKKNRQIARAYFEFAAQKGHADAMWNSGVLYSETGCENEDYNKSMEYLERATKHGTQLGERNVNAQMELTEALRVLHHVKRFVHDSFKLRREENPYLEQVLESSKLDHLMNSSIESEVSEGHDTSQLDVMNSKVSRRE